MLRQSCRYRQSEHPFLTPRELGLQIALGYAVIPTKGWAVPEAEHAFTRARVLSQRVSEAPLLFGALWGLWAFYLVRADYRTSREFAEQCAALAEQAQDSDLLIEAYLGLAVDSYHRGEVTAARGHLERSISLYERERHRSHAFLYGQDPCVTALVYLGWVLWVLGYPERARVRAQESLALARQLSHPFSLGWALLGHGILHQFLLAWREVQSVAEETLVLATEQGFADFVGWASALCGLALVRQGQHESGIAQLKQALRTRRAAGSGLQVPGWLGWLAVACGCADQADEGLDALDEALMLIEKTGEHLWESEVWRYRWTSASWIARARCSARADARFCSGCGQPSGLSCPAGGTANLPDNRFCTGCGRAFPASAHPGRPGSPPSLPLPAAVPVHQPGAERRQLTVMFCDLGGSTALSARLDPEALREVVRACQTACAHPRPGDFRGPRHADRARQGAPGAGAAIAVA